MVKKKFPIKLKYKLNSIKDHIRPTKK